MKVIALLPVRNEAWVLRHSLACLSAFCDVVLVNDQNSDDGSPDICREFPKVVLIESRVAEISTHARWTMWDAARSYEGCNLIWCTDADELVSPRLVRAFLQRDRERLTPGTVVDCLYHHAWHDQTQYRVQALPYAPYWKPIAVVDDRRMDYDRARLHSIHEERVPVTDTSRRLRADDVPVLHLQWLLPHRNQMRQAWYRCHDWMKGEATAASINEHYSITLPATTIRTAPVPPRWMEDVTFPDFAIDGEPTWADADVRRWFDERGPAFFEPIEIWHIEKLREAFLRATGRQPKPDRSYRASWPVRAQRLGRRMFSAARRRLPI